MVIKICMTKTNFLKNEVGAMTKITFHLYYLLTVHHEATAGLCREKDMLQRHFAVH